MRTRSTELPNYRILVEGLIAPNWSDCLGGLAISVHERPSQPPVTEMSGRLRDQAALQGVLDTLFMLNIPVLLVERDQQIAEPTNLDGADPRERRDQ